MPCSNNSNTLETVAPSLSEEQTPESSSSLTPKPGSDKLYLSKPTLDKYTDFIYCKELQTKARFYTESFFDDIGIPYNLSDNMSSIRFGGMLVFLNDNSLADINNIVHNVVITPHDDYNFGFNVNLYTGDSIEDIKKIYGEPHKIIPDSIGTETFSIGMITK